MLEEIEYRLCVVVVAEVEISLCVVVVLEVEYRLCVVVVEVVETCYLRLVLDEPFFWVVDIYLHLRSHQ